MRMEVELIRTSFVDYIPARNGKGLSHLDVYRGAQSDPRWGANHGIDSLLWKCHFGGDNGSAALYWKGLFTYGFRSYQDSLVIRTRCSRRPFPLFKGHLKERVRFNLCVHRWPGPSSDLVMRVRHLSASTFQCHLPLSDIYPANYCRSSTYVAPGRCLRDWARRTWQR